MSRTFAIVIAVFFIYYPFFYSPFHPGPERHEVFACNIKQLCCWTPRGRFLFLFLLLFLRSFSFLTTFFSSKCPCCCWGQGIILKLFSLTTWEFRLAFIFQNLLLLSPSWLSDCLKNLRFWSLTN